MHCWPILEPTRGDPCRPNPLCRPPDPCNQLAVSYLSKPHHPCTESCRPHSSASSINNSRYRCPTVVTAAGRYVAVHGAAASPEIKQHQGQGQPGVTVSYLMR